MGFAIVGFFFVAVFSRVDFSTRLFDVGCIVSIILLFLDLMVDLFFVFVTTRDTSITTCKKRSPHGVPFFKHVGPCYGFWCSLAPPFTGDTRATRGPNFDNSPQAERCRDTTGTICERTAAVGQDTEQGHILESKC